MGGQKGVGGGSWLWHLSAVPSRTSTLESLGVISNWVVSFNKEQEEEGSGPSHTGKQEALV